MGGGGGVALIVRNMWVHLQPHIYYFLVRYLEWDYGSDLGYLEDKVSQVEAAQSLSTLEKLAIGSYTEYLRDPAQDHQQQNLSRLEAFNFSLRLFKRLENQRRQRKLYVAITYIQFFI